MSADFRFALYVFCMDYHGGQWSRLYRIMCKLRCHLSDRAIKAIQHGRNDPNDEWLEARQHYRALKRSKYAHDTK